MNSWRRIRSGAVIGAVLAGLAAASATIVAQTKPEAQTKPPAQTKPAAEQQPAQVEKFTGTTVNVNPGAGENITIRVLRWSADADREKLIAAFKEKGDAGLQTAFEGIQTLGYIWTSESLGYSLRYAHRVALPDGGERIIVATDRRLGVWTRGNPWKSSAQGAPDYPFTLVELKLNRRGQGEGKMSIATKVTVEPDGKVIALENYASAPVLLKDVKRDPASGKPTG